MFDTYLIYDSLVAEEFGCRPTFASSGPLLFRQALLKNIIVTIGMFLDSCGQVCFARLTQELLMKPLAVSWTR